MQVVAGVTRQLKEQRQGTSAELTAARQALEQKDTELNDANLKLRELVAQEAALQQSLKTVRSFNALSICRKLVLRCAGGHT